MHKVTLARWREAGSNPNQEGHCRPSLSFGFTQAVRRQQRFIVGRATVSDQLWCQCGKWVGGERNWNGRLFRRSVLQWELVGALGMGPRDISELCMQDLVVLSYTEVITCKTARMLKLSPGVQR